MCLILSRCISQVRVWAISKGTQVMIASMKEHKGPVYAISIKARAPAELEHSLHAISRPALTPFSRPNSNAGRRLGVRLGLG